MSYALIIERILSKLSEGVVPWRKPWGRGPCLAPRNLDTGARYRGINVLVLALRDYDLPLWVTFKQAVKLGGNVRRGEQATPVVFWKRLDADNHDESDGGSFVARRYSAFNVEQCEGLEHLVPERRFFEPVDSDAAVVKAQRLVDGWRGCPEIRHGSNKAYYLPRADVIHLPRPTRFDSMESYYATLFHELVHATGHQKRLGRHRELGMTGFGTDAYCLEELIAEIGASFLCGEAGIECATLDNSAAYIHGWMTRLKESPSILVRAAAYAQRAVDCILQKKWD